MRYFTIFIFIFSALYSDSFDKTRAKTLSNKSSRYNYVEIRNKKDLRGLNRKDIGIALKHQRGNVLNYVKIKNTSFSTFFDKSRRKKTASDFINNATHYDTNFGVIVQGSTRGKVTNHVEVKNSNIDNYIGSNTNLGTVIRDNNANRLKIKNKVIIKDSNIGGLRGIRRSN